MESLTVEKLDDFLSKRKCTLLGVGPMSKNCIDASIEISNEHNIPLMLIASRRQIDSNESGGGYVNNWTTEKFSEYVKICDKNKNIILCRDHGGPWQNDYEKNNKLNFHEAMESAKKSFAVDIKSNFQIIHIDPTIDIHTEISKEKIFLLSNCLHIHRRIHLNQSVSYLQLASTEHYFRWLIQCRHQYNFYS